MIFSACERKQFHQTMLVRFLKFVFICLYLPRFSLCVSMSCLSICVCMSLFARLLTCTYLYYSVCFGVSIDDINTLRKWTLCLQQGELNLSIRVLPYSQNSELSVLVNEMFVFFPLNCDWFEFLCTTSNLSHFNVCKRSGVSPVLYCCWIISNLIYRKPEMYFIACFP